MNDDLVKKIVFGVLILAVIIGIFIIIFTSNIKENILGLVFGAMAGILNLKLLNNSIINAVNMEPKAASGYSTRRYLIRYLISFLVLLVAVLADYLNMITTLVGLLLVKMVIIIDSIFFNKLNKVS